MIEAVQQVVSQLPPDVKVIPGHGPVSSLDDVGAYLGMLKETRDPAEVFTSDWFCHYRALFANDD